MRWTANYHQIPCLTRTFSWHRYCDIFGDCVSHPMSFYSVRPLKDGAAGWRSPELFLFYGRLIYDNLC